MERMIKSRQLDKLFTYPHSDYTHRGNMKLLSSASTCLFDYLTRSPINFHNQIWGKQNLPERNVVWRQVNKKDNILPDVSSKEYLPRFDNSGCGKPFLVNRSFSTLKSQPEIFPTTKPSLTGL
jgi:hypothetical protein